MVRTKEIESVEVRKKAVLPASFTEMRSSKYWLINAMFLDAA